VASVSIGAMPPPQFVFIVGSPDWIDEDPSMIDR
jgi:hypothetical protein